MVDIRPMDGVESLPWVSGGKFTVKVNVPALPDKSGRLCGPLSARAEITTPTLDSTAVTSSNFSLKQEGDCGAYQGLTELAWPAGGAFQVRVTVAGEEQVHELRMDEPLVRVVPGLQTREGARLKVPLCIVSSASRGTVTLTVEGGTLEDGQAVGRVNLGSMDCGAPMDSPRARWASAALFTTSERVTIRADLEGRANDVRSVELAQDLQSLDLRVEPEPSTLPPPGSVFAVTIIATLNGDAADGVPVRLETTPAAEILPATGITGEQGTFVAHITVPEGARSMRIDAISGSLRRGEFVPPSP
ncbi:hypothetical protein [Cystobacter fuscus]|uniref:hypothetical protein n=1 Tax=Cystobacter fuscus TaxID=43 RepID=UPI0002AE1CCA|nr:hypothetical protein [Cystobacter fuscus]